MQRSSQFTFGLLLTFGLAGCDVLDPIITTGLSSDSGDPTNLTGAETGTSTGEPDPETSGAVTTAVTETGTSEGASDSNDSGAFIMPYDPPDCDVWAQDCPFGEKCSADGAAPLGDEDIKCVPIVPDPDQPGEPCHVVPGQAGPDTCDIGSFCWSTDPVTGEGICVENCQGSPNSPTCDPNNVCLPMAVPICLPACDPLLQDCPSGDSCLPLVESFTCFPAADPGGSTFDPCDGLDQCAPGLVCVSTASAVECDKDEAGCCSPYCDLDDVNSCAGAGQECVPWFGPGQAPVGLDNLGVCSTPL